MNSQKKYKIQALIAEIDEVLSKPVPRLPWTGSMDTVHQRHLLERVRTYLVSPDSKLVVPTRAPSSLNAEPATVAVTTPTAAANQQAVDQILLAVTEEINNLREDLMQPLQEDIQALRQEQEALIQEIKLLEAKRQQQQSLAQQQANQQQIIAEFLQALTSRLEETFDRAVLAAPPSRGETQLLPGSESEAGEMTAAQRLQQMQLLQARADNLMMSLDSTMSIVFQTLEGNLQSYQESLSLGLDKMHGLGQQSEAMFAALVNHLASQLGREASAYVQPLDFSSLENATSTPAEIDQAESETMPNALGESENRPRSQFGEQERFPYAGTEMSPQFGQLKRDRDRTQSPISLPDLEENLFGGEPGDDRPTTPFPGAESAQPEAETDRENVEDLYASLFAGDEIAELELEDFAIENTENSGGIELPQSENAPENETAEDSINAVDLLTNLLDENESVEDFIGRENSDFPIANYVDELTLDTEDLFEPEAASSRETATPLASASEHQLDFAEPKNQAIAPDNPSNPSNASNPARSDNVAASQTRPLPPPPPPPPAFRTSSETNLNSGSVGPRVPSARDVQTGEFGDRSQSVNDTYIQASPDEDLLPIDLSEASIPDRSLNVDNNTLQLLEADLYSMEDSEHLGGRRSPPPAGINSRQFAEVAGENPENPFAGAAAAELGSLDDLFAEVSEVSSEDEQSWSWEEELDVELFEEDEESSLSLDEILASLTPTDETSVNSGSPLSETNSPQSNSGESQKKN